MSSALGLGLVYIKMEYISMIQSIDDVFIVASVLCLLGFMLSFFLMDVRQRHPARSEAAESLRESIALEG
jgi:hypothetical protein